MFIMAPCGNSSLSMSLAYYILISLGGSQSAASPRAVNGCNRVNHLLGDNDPMKLRSEEMVHELQCLFHGTI